MLTCDAIGEKIQHAVADLANEGEETPNNQNTQAQQPTETTSNEQNADQKGIIKSAEESLKNLVGTVIQVWPY